MVLFDGIKNGVLNFVQKPKKIFFFFFSPFFFQVDKSDIQTCGRYVTMRILMMLKGYDLLTFQRYMKQRKSEEKLTYDEIVSEHIKN